MLRIVSNTDRGMVREQNQDVAKSGCLESGIIWSIVCDGMGGAAGGNIASRIVADSFEQSVDDGLSGDFDDKSIKNFLIAAMARANVLVCEKIDQEPDLAGMGTTAVACIIHDHTVHIAHLGDSRAYLVGEGIIQITKDHSMIQMLVEQGQITAEEAKTHPKRNVITRALGISRDVEAEYNTLVLEDEQYILICTDGITNLIEDEEIFAVIKENDFYNCTAKLIELANSRGGSDNATAVMIG